MDDKVYEKLLNNNEKVHQASSSSDLQELINNESVTYVSSLVQKFRVGLKRNNEKQKIIVFIDECHRTQSGKLHSEMKKVLPDAVFIGFTGTPLLTKDKNNTKLKDW